MKAYLTALYLILTSNLIAAEEPKKLDELKTSDGKIYKNVTIREVTPSKIKIFHESGATSISLADLSVELQKEFNYDPKKIEAIAKEQAEALREQRLQAWLRLPIEKQYSVHPADAEGISLDYRDYRHLELEVQEKAQNERFSTNRLRAELSILPKGGRVVVSLRRSTIGAANTENFLAIVTDSQGKEIVRRNGPDDIATVPTTAGGAWSNLFHVDLPKDIGSGVTIRVVDRLDNKAVDFTLRPTK